MRSRLALSFLILSLSNQAPPPVPTLREDSVPSALSELSFEADTTVGLVRHPSGCLLIADPAAAQLVCVDLRTGVSRRMGRRGGGPGEFASIAGLAVQPDGGLIVYDPANGRLTLFQPDWAYQGSMPLPSALNAGPFRATAESIFALGGRDGWEVVNLSLRTGMVVPRFAPGRQDSARFLVPLYQTWGFYLQPDGADGWLVAGIGQYLIQRLDRSGKTISVAGRKLEPEFPSAAEQAARQAQVARLNPGLSPEQIQRLAARVRGYASAPKPFTTRSGFGDDYRGRLWVVTPRIRSDSTELDLFDHAGRYLGTRRIPDRVQSMTFSGSEILLLVEYLAGPRLGMQGVRRYRIVEPAP